MTSVPSPLATRRIGMIGGGNMAGALVRGLLVSGHVTKEQVRASDVLEEKRRALEAAHGIVTTDDNAAVARFSDVVVLAVKPQVIAQAAATLAEALAPETLVVSVAAGVTIRALETLLPHSRRIVRAMPNTPALVLAGATAIAASSGATNADLAAATALFEAVGSVVRVEESLLDAVTGTFRKRPGLRDARHRGADRRRRERRTRPRDCALTRYRSRSRLREAPRRNG